MSFSRAFQWYHSHAEPIWPDGTFKQLGRDIATYIFKSIAPLPIFLKQTVLRNPSVPREYVSLCCVQTLLPK